jgi:hypothetical protein
MVLNAWKGLAVIGIIAALVVSGVGIFAHTTDDSMNLGDELKTEPEIQVIEQVDENETDTLTVKVGVRVEGQLVPIQGATVKLLSVDTTRDNNTVTIVLERIAIGETDENGTITCGIDHGKYLVLATYNGLTGIGKCNLEEDTEIGVLLHNRSMNKNQFRTGFVHTFRYMENVTIQIDLESLQTK